jgi:hypothetical protein
MWALKYVAIPDGVQIIGDEETRSSMKQERLEVGQLE